MGQSCPSTCQKEEKTRVLKRTVERCGRVHSSLMGAHKCSFFTAMRPQFLHV